MATLRWTGSAGAVAKVWTFQITAYDATTTYKLTSASGQVISVLAAGSANATATAFETAITASEFPEFSEVTADSSTDTVTLTGVTAGKPFTFTTSVSGGTGTISAGTTTTADTGPNHWDNATNWSGGAVPVNSDTVILEGPAVQIWYGLAQSAVTLTELILRATDRLEIGLPQTNTDNATSYSETRAQYLAIGATTVTSEWTGTGRIRLDTGSVQTTINCTSTGTSLDTDLPAFLFKGTHASNALNINKGDVGVALLTGETATVATLRVGYVDSVDGDASVKCSSGVTLTTIEQSGGVVEIASNVTTITKTDGSITVGGSATVTTANVDGGEYYHKSTGTLTTLKVGSDGVASFTRDMRARTVTNCEVYKGGTLLDSFKTVTWTNGIDVVRCSLSEVTIDIGTHFTITPSAI